MAQQFIQYGSIGYPADLPESFRFGLSVDLRLQLLRRQADNVFVLVTENVVGLSIQVLQHDLTIQHRLLPLRVGSFLAMEFRHDFLSEHFQ